ncbi:MAG: hypothetical protein UY51_C0005G0618 [Candidatus Jorgensenbacteria bacterium GW2011_GWB1_49_9]|nr:MAG: hypothetical protein UY51_C0005G0618 [Candidatus Jorgensenbacteria bacterium GW2011_GWB1_49_9]
MKLEEFKKEILKDSKTRKSYYKSDIAFDLGLLVIEARIKKSVTQEKLARLLGTKQPAIARIENGSVEVKNSFLARIAKVLGMEFVLPNFAYHDEIYSIALNKGQINTSTVSEYYEPNHEIKSPNPDIKVLIH